MNSSTFFTLILVFIATLGNAQITFEKGYVITLKGDTVYGEIKLNTKKEIDFFSKVVFKISDTDKKTYKPDKIREYNVHGQSFVSKQVEGKVVFLRRATQGAVILYEYEYEATGLTEDVVTDFDYYIQKAGQEELIKIKENKFRKQLAEIMSDNTEIVAELQDKKTGYDKILELVKKYNQGG